MLRPRVSYCFVVLLFVFLELPCHVHGQNLGSWSVGVPAPTQRTEVSVTVLGENIYVIGGLSRPRFGSIRDVGISRVVEVYHADSQSWTTTTQLPEGRHHAGITALDGSLYLVGGFTASLSSKWRAVSTLYRYDPSTAEWTTLAPMPTARGALGVAVYDGELYAIGGYDGTANPAVVEVYDPQTNAWRNVAVLPTPRDHLAVVTEGARIYAIGGRSNLDYRRNLSVVEVYDPLRSVWRRSAELPTARSGITAGVLDGSIYVFGGESVSGTFATNEAFLPHENRWISMAPMPTARHGLGSAVLNGRVYVLCGGPTPGGSFSSVNEIFVPPQRVERPIRRGTKAALIGSVMALLATFDEAQVLPPEHDPRANQLIHTLIQVQSAILKSQSPVIHEFVLNALRAKHVGRAEELQARLEAHGLSMHVLEALVDYDALHPIWERAELVEGFQAFNVQQVDWMLVRTILLRAREQLKPREKTLTDVFARRRLEMPGAVP